MTRSWPRAKSGLVILAAWTVLALFYLPQTYLLNLRAPQPLSLLWAFAATAALFYAWALLTPLVLWLGRRFPFERGVMGRRLLTHMVAGVAVSLVQLLLLTAAHRLLARGTPDYESPVPVMALVVGYGATNVMIYWGLLAVGHAIVYFRRYQDREFRLAEAQLQSLRTQLHPHFLFNTLNAIAELIYQDPPRAERTLTRLSDLLRSTLARTDDHEVPLGEDLQFLRAYLDVQHTLLEERLHVVWNVADETLRASVPAMILQPLVENAIRHGIGPRAAGGMLTITSSRRGERLLLRVEDDGVGIAQGTPATGIGLGNTGARLRHLYPGNHRFDLTPGDRGGTVATIDIPFHDFAR